MSPVSMISFTSGASKLTETGLFSMSKQYPFLVSQPGPFIQLGHYFFWKSVILYKTLLTWFSTSKGPYDIV